jgi:hypothetical protein
MHLQKHSKAYCKAREIFFLNMFEFKYNLQLLKLQNAMYVQDCVV